MRKLTVDSNLLLSKDLVGETTSESNDGALGRRVVQQIRPANKSCRIQLRLQHVFMALARLTIDRACGTDLSKLLHTAR